MIAHTGQQFRLNLAQILKEVRDEESAAQVTRHGRPEIVVASSALWDRLVWLAADAVVAGQVPELLARGEHPLGATSSDVMELAGEGQGPRFQEFFADAWSEARRAFEAGAGPALAEFLSAPQWQRSISDARLPGQWRYSLVATGAGTYLVVGTSDEAIAAVISAPRDLHVARRE